MWGMKTETIPVIGALGLMKKGLQKHTVNSMGQSTSMSSVQKKDSIRNSPHTKEGFVLKANLSALLFPRTMIWTRTFRSVQQTEQQEFT